MNELSLSLFSYLVIFKEFYLEDFCFIFGFKLEDSLKVADSLDKEGYLRHLDTRVVVTKAGYEALLGPLFRRGGRWWLLADIKNAFKPFIFSSIGLALAPFSWVLWDQVKDLCNLGVIVRGWIGNEWLKRYSKPRILEKIYKIGSDFEVLEKRVLESPVSVEYARSMLFLLFRDLTRILEVLNLPKPELPQVEDVGELLVAIRDLKEYLILTRRKLRDIIS